MYSIFNSYVNPLVPEPEIVSQKSAIWSKASFSNLLCMSNFLEIFSYHNKLTHEIIIYMTYLSMCR